jgi:hypothetical protein
LFSRSTVVFAFERLGRRKQTIHCSTIITLTLIRSFCPDTLSCHFPITSSGPVRPFPNCSTHFIILSKLLVRAIFESTSGRKDQTEFAFILDLTLFVNYR